MYKRLFLLVAIGFLLSFSFLGTSFSTTLQATTTGLDFDNAVSTYYSQGLTLSVDKFRQLILNYPNNQELKLDLIQLLRETGQYHAAISHLQMLASQDPNNINYRWNLIQMNYLAGKYEEAVRISKCPDLSAGELFWRGLALAELGEINEGIQTLANSLSKEPFNPMAS